MPVELQRMILEFTDPGFEPLKRVNKLFQAFEKTQKRQDAMKEQITKRNEEFWYGDKKDREVDKLLPYVISINLLDWALGELEIPKDHLVCAATATGGHLDVLKWARAQNPPCDWNADVCRYAAKKGHLDVLKWARAQNPPCPEYDDDDNDEESNDDESESESESDGDDDDEDFSYIDG